MHDLERWSMLPAVLSAGRAFLLVVGVGGFAASASGHDAALTTFRVLSVQTSSRYVDELPRGFSKGDRHFAADRLVNIGPLFGKPKGAVVGMDAQTITFTSPSTAVFDAVVRLPGGTLRIHGQINEADAPTAGVPIVSGTGRFLGARGVVIEVGTNPKAIVNTFRLTYR